MSVESQIIQIAVGVLRLEAGAEFDPAKCLVEHYGMDSFAQIDFLYQVVEAFGKEGELERMCTSDIGEDRQPFSVQNIVKTLQCA